MKRAAWIILAIGCLIGCGGGGGSTNVVDACHDFCDLLTECQLRFLGFGYPCNDRLCESVVERRVGEDDDCDDAWAEWAECFVEFTCEEIETPVCQSEFNDLYYECDGFP